MSAASAESTPPASPPPAAPELDNPTDPFIERLRLLAAQGGLCAGLTTVDDGFEIHSAHKMAIAKQLDLKPKALDYLLSRHGQPRNGPEGTVYWIAGR